VEATGELLDAVIEQTMVYRGVRRAAVGSRPARRANGLYSYNNRDTGDLSRAASLYFGKRERQTGRLPEI
jgi:hypothetical protein